MKKTKNLVSGFILFSLLSACQTTTIAPVSTPNPSPPIGSPVPTLVPTLPLVSSSPGPSVTPSPVNTPGPTAQPSAPPPQSIEDEIRANRVNNIERDYHSLARNSGGDFVFAWQGANSEIFARKFNSSGTPVTVEIKVNTL